MGIRLRNGRDVGLVGGWLLRGLLTQHAPFPVISAAPVTEFPARLGDRRLLDLVVAVVHGDFSYGAYGMGGYLGVAWVTRSILK
jgi:hypothetical protein